ncbi:transposase [Xenorhabdus budapestensis]|uniref:Transposase n=1 Tax=Xenorhabdus budapestensis TaxID=290110 RepID=A0A2D0J4K5_XENBU|nr:transposase [Xenorhabdus budapestensis]
MSQPNPLCVGIDVAKASLDIAINTGAKEFTASNDIDGFDAILSVLKPHSITGSYGGNRRAGSRCRLYASG